MTSFMRKSRHPFRTAIAAVAVIAAGLTGSAVPAVAAPAPPAPVGLSRAGLARLLGNPAPAAKVSAAAAPSGLTCPETISLRSLASNLYVTTEAGVRDNTMGLLRARSATVGAWEKIQVCYDLNGSDTVAYLVPTVPLNGQQRPVTAVLDGSPDIGNRLQARDTNYGPWEQFLMGQGPGYVYLFSFANRNYVSAELGFGGNFNGMLRARASTVGPWEKFAIARA